MDNISGAWLYAIILLAGALQAWGPPMNGTLRNALTNPWLASVASFVPVVALLGVLLLCQPRPITTAEGIANMPWWAGCYLLARRFVPSRRSAGLSVRAG